MPRLFKQTFVDPSFHLWKANHLVVHLAVHAASQIDIMAEVVAKHQGQPLGQYKKSLCSRRPALQVMCDIHDNHKHGAVTRYIELRTATKGQRPEEVLLRGHFFGKWNFGSPMTAYRALRFLADDGTSHDLSKLLIVAHSAWDDELNELGI
ncbi:hypothetical protein [Devosia sp.]|uniref:hypothetical protein n=1 Tax=Devosia sp. TaxID=1871048 RepID=UPI001AC1184B|nr:hypothetical protein [Devosia sp.]MBN9335288.1 hypothetical protein [Devosia sp.]